MSRMVFLAFSRLKDCFVAEFALSEANVLLAMTPHMTNALLIFSNLPCTKGRIVIF